MLSTITPYFGLFSARAEFAVHGASIAASHKNVCWEVAARHYSAQLAPSCNQTYKYVIWSISCDNTSHLFYLLRCNVGVFKRWKFDKEPWKISRSIGSSGWIVCKFADDVWCLQAKPSLCLLPGQTQVISVGHCIVCILQAVKEGEVMEQVWVLCNCIWLPSQTFASSIFVFVDTPSPGFFWIHHI